ncbi:(Z)-2-((N-methylformamido)methylene)-5-hydroxybutyrolactone dehydrogenase-like [Euwallacea similis]|uniref:(Z)-2-((N-methylformamido)methylene)-5- hydroxybutyrolactone dehydrogenase-like n=1 Tax=Euwallacea similis TaxID=1736056 RepID=UPI00344FE676
MEISSEKIQEALKSMNYGESIENTSQANEWVEMMEIEEKMIENDTILKIAKVGSYTITRSILVRLAQELEKNAKLISQIEVLSRGILAKDTLPALQTLAEYFYYYASFVEGGSKDIVVGIFEDDHPLWLLGLFLGPAIASGHKIILQTGTKFAAVACFVIKLAVEVGVPKEALFLVSSNSGELQHYLSHKEISIVALFVNVLNEKYQGINRFHKKILILSGYKSPMLVFDDCDLDSSVECAIEASWGYQGMLPWAADSILIQENVFQKFVQKLKSRIQALKIGNGDDKFADISYLDNPNTRKNLLKSIEKAKSLGIEIFQKGTDGSNVFTPTLSIGSKISTNNVLTAPQINTIVALLPFRTIDEAVNLANNGRQGLGASIWSENIGLLNEVSRKLKVGNVWINSHGLVSPNIPFTPLKDSGVGYFGGKQGFTEYNAIKTDTTSTEADISNSLKDIEAVKKAINAGKIAMAGWEKIPNIEKIKVISLIVINFLEKNEKRFSEKLPEHWVNNFKANLQFLLREPHHLGNFTQNGFSVNSLKYPRGILAIETRPPFESHPVKLLLAALYEGNSVILLNESPETQDFYQEIAKQFPLGLLSVIPFSLDAVATASRHKELNAYFSRENVIFGSLPLRESKIFQRIASNLDWEHVFNLVTVVKNIWSNCGQSSQYSI